MKINFPVKNIFTYILLLIALLVTFWFISFFEVFSIIFKGMKVNNFGLMILYKLLNDFWTSFFIGLILLPFFLLFNAFIKKHWILFFQILFSVIIIIQFSLVKYSLTTLLNLGADLLGYSFNDITLTVSSSESMSLVYFVPFMLAISVFFILNKVFSKLISERSIIAGSLISILVFGGLKLVISESSESIYQNKLSYLISDVYKFQKEKNEINSYNLAERNDYPFLKPYIKSNDVLSPFFNVEDKKPNIVIIIVEGLGAEFVGENTYSGFTPYLDSLISESLYWENFVSTSGRTFGVLPSLLASLPYGENGFMELPKLPSHISLMSILKSNGYTTSFFTGDPSSFDRKINFLEYNGIDNVIDEEKFGGDFVKTSENSGGFSWGYPDAEIFRKALSVMDANKQPRLDIIMTLTNHEPFDFPSKEVYKVKVDSILNVKNISNELKTEIKSYQDIFASILYSDASIKGFIDEFKKRPEFENTVFVITGDHRLIPITQKDKLCRFHVPFYIYSPLLKKAERFKSISSHWDVTPSLLSFLTNNYQLNKLDEVAWMSQGLDTAKQFRNIHEIPLMRYKGNINDYIYKDYLFSDGELFKINENFGTYKVIEKDLVIKVAESLKEFKKLNIYTTSNNRIFPDSLNIYMNPAIEFSTEELSIINELTEGLTFDQSFNLARETAFKKDYKKARLICDYILNEYPNYADARILKGRTLAWEGKYDEAEFELLNVIKRTPYYYDCYLAIMDLYWWSKKDEKGIEMAQKAFENDIIHEEISFKLAKAYQRMNNSKNAIKIMDSLLVIYPENKDFLTFKQTLQ
jgi:lipoteichoic acid synthase